jgi:hypothetical protein
VSSDGGEGGNNDTATSTVPVVARGLAQSGDRTHANLWVAGITPDDLQQTHDDDDGDDDTSTTKKQVNFERQDRRSWLEEAPAQR